MIEKLEKGKLNFKPYICTMYIYTTHNMYSR